MRNAKGDDFVYPNPYILLGLLVPLAFILGMLLGHKLTKAGVE